MKHAYFIGIGGIGMSALAQYVKAQKWAVSGSDAAKSPILDTLRKAGIKAKIGQKGANLPKDIDLVVVSQAIRPDNPELKEARRRRIGVLTYPEVVAEITKENCTVAVAGAHGKSTTTALAALVMVRGGLDPTVIVGTKLREFHGRNFRAGRSGRLVLEADEFGNAFSDYRPTVAVVTNIDREHLETYGTLARVKKAFLHFLGNTVDGGALILNRDDKNLWSLRREIAKLEKRKSLRVIWHSNRGTTAAKIRRIIKIPGEHNVTDAVAAYKVGRVFDIPHRTVQQAIAAYRGAWRRMEYRGKFRAPGAGGGALVYDDYGHHPTEIKATLKAFRQKYPDKKILCVFQPHLSERLHSLFREFMGAFDHADETIILPIYKVAGRHTPPGKYDAQALVRAIQRREPRKPLFYLGDPGKLKDAILALSRSGGTSPLSRKVIVMMGAGDIADYTAGLLGRG